ncbi:pyridoxal-phosphate dependent enzyme [Desmospora activa]|uniref:threonine ammonia-lyase n=1 Tax=Desmospora activa DSM 45169 TaxID=1121389 RepID=A0A2T4Z0E4_9BACL|nr:pyridoxal-phosphate dependent enzyme [Desmospora activa]PTM53211.1 threonine dehydratase [Desmospora activa DSM 45169]
MTAIITAEEVEQAVHRLEGVAHRTPVMTSRTLNRYTGRNLFLKCENFQRAGAFKFRGAYNTIAQLSSEEKKNGVIAFSSGNHAQAVTVAAHLLGVKATICMPTDAPRVKRTATEEYGATIVSYDRLTEDREQLAQQIAAETGATLIPPYDDPRIIAGQGTAAYELLQDIPNLDAIITPVGGGGLLSGTALAARHQSGTIRIFGAEPAQAADTYRSLQAGRRLAIDPPDTIADGLRNTAPGSLTFPVIQSLVEDIVTVSEAEIRDALRWVFLRLKLVIEPSSAVPIAALINGRLPGEFNRVGIIVSGGNIDPVVLADVMGEERQ